MVQPYARIASMKRYFFNEGVKVGVIWDVGVEDVLVGLLVTRASAEHPTAAISFQL